MASREEILGILAGESGPMSRTALGKRLNLPTSSFQNQLDRMENEKPGLVEKNEQSDYTITEAGRQVVLNEPPGGKTPPGEETDESLKTTEYQQFIEMGKTTGVVPMALIEQTASHIWRGGDFRDLTWVWKGLTEMGIRSDLAQRWFHSWRSYLHQAIPPALVSVTTSQIAEGATLTKETAEIGKGKRDYILDANGLPLYVGEGVGDLDHDDMVKLSALRQVALARGGVQAAPGGQPATMGTMADEMTKVFTAVKEFLGPQSKGKSYIVKPGEGGYEVEEVDEGKPTVITSPGQGSGTPSPSFLIDADGNVTEAAAGRPIVIKQAAQPLSSPGKTYLVRQTAEGLVTEEFEAGKPIIINASASQSSNIPMMPFPVIGGDGQPVYDSEGKPVYANIEPMMKWMGFQGQQRREDERHSALMGLAQTVRENIPDGIQAILRTAAEVKGGGGAKAPPQEKKLDFKCGDCGAQFSPPAGWTDQPLKCPNPDCGREYSKEELLE